VTPAGVDPVRVLKDSVCSLLVAAVCIGRRLRDGVWITRSCGLRYARIAAAARMDPSYPTGRVGVPTRSPGCAVGSTEGGFMTTPGHARTATAPLLRAAQTDQALNLAVMCPMRSFRATPSITSTILDDLDASDDLDVATDVATSPGRRARTAPGRTGARAISVTSTNSTSNGSASSGTTREALVHVRPEVVHGQRRHINGRIVRRGRPAVGERRLRRSYALVVVEDVPRIPVRLDGL
jgi:hypothetical protein